MRGFALLLALLCGMAPWTAAGGQETPQSSSPAAEAADLHGQPTLVFAFVPRTPEQAPWVIRIGPDQSGSYRELPPGAPEQAVQPIHVSEAVWKLLMAPEATVRRAHCETRQKGLAQTGSKTFSLEDGTMLASCTFNYSDDDHLNDAANEFLALAEMVHAGAKLQHDHRFDRLALDADIDSLLAEMAGGRAIEPGNIAAVLQSIEDDERVIDRVRRKAARLLQAPSVAPAVPSTPAASQRLKPR